MSHRIISALKASWNARRFERRIARARRSPTVELVSRVATRLNASGRLDEAESLLDLGLAHAPDHPGLVEQLAFSAHHSGRHRDALERWRRLLVLRPDLPMAWCGIAANARELGKLDEATAAIDEALRRFPGDVVATTEAARVRERCGAHAEAAELWRSVLAHSCADKTWHLAVARNLIALDRYDEVEAILAALQAPEDLGSAKVRRDMAREWSTIAATVAAADRAGLARHLAEAVSRFGEQAYAIAHVAETVDDVAAARVALEQLVERAPDDLEARISYAHVLLRTERVDDAENQVKCALELSPGDDMLVLLQGLIAIRRHDWAAAYTFATAYAEHHPGDHIADDLLDRMRRLRELEEAEKAHDPARLVPIAPPIVDDPDLRQLVLKFESFGEDCEFGTVQRHYGAEPLGLLRWTETSVVSLMSALTAGFEGMGDPQHTELTVGPIGNIFVRDKRWNLVMHTFLYDTEVSVEVLYPKMCRRTAYLRDKLLDDLRSGEKTVIFKSDLPAMSDLLALHDTLLRFGPNRLLNVRHAVATRGVPAAEPGSVREIRPGLFVAHLSRMSYLSDIAYDEWVMACRGVERLGAESTATDLVPGLASAA